MLAGRYLSRRYTLPPRGDQRPRLPGPVDGTEPSGPAGRLRQLPREPLGAADMAHSAACWVGTRVCVKLRPSVMTVLFARSWACVSFGMVLVACSGDAPDSSNSAGGAAGSRGTSGGGAHR